MTLFGYIVTWFDVVATIAFVSQLANYTWFGYMRKHKIAMSNRHAALATFTLICFSITEATIAIEDGRISMWLYVLLNIYGIIHLWYSLLFGIKKVERE